MSESSLHWACKNLCIDKVKELLEDDEDIDAKDDLGKTPVHIAICEYIYHISRPLCSSVSRKESETYDAIINVLLRCGADVNISDNFGISPLHRAASSGNPEIVGIIMFLLKQNADIFSKDNKNATVLHHSVIGGDPVVTKLLILRGCSVNECDHGGQTPLHWAAGRGNVDLVKLLLRSGAEINRRDYLLGRIPLHLSCWEGNVEVTEFLLQNGADTLATDNTGMTPLHLSVNSFDPDIDVITLILESIPDVDIRNHSGETALHLAANDLQDESASILLKHGADLNAQSTNGETPLHKAIQAIKLLGDDSLTVSLLLKSDPNFNLVDNRGQAPLDLVTDMEHRFESRKVIMSYACKLSAAGLAWTDKARKTLLTNNLSSFYHKCELEIYLMKTRNINGVSFYNLLIKSFKELVAHLRNPGLKECLDTFNYKSEFPIYGSMLKRRLDPALKKAHLTHLAEQFFSFLPENLPELPTYCIENILYYLSDRDLKILSDCCA